MEENRKQLERITVLRWFLINLFVSRRGEMDSAEGALIKRNWNQGL